MLVLLYDPDTYPSSGNLSSSYSWNPCTWPPFRVCLCMCAYHSPCKLFFEFEVAYQLLKFVVCMGPGYSCYHIKLLGYITHLLE